jgi:hypothetical protein
MVISFPRTGDQEVEQVAGDCRVAGSIPILLRDKLPKGKTHIGAISSRDRNLLNFKAGSLGIKYIIHFQYVQ